MTRLNNHISEKQHQIFKFIIETIKNLGYPPTVREIAEAVNLSSSATVHSHLKKLEQSGYIKRGKGSSRTIEILNTSYIPRDDVDRSDLGNVVLIPIVGNVAAGTPILAQENIEEYFPVTSDFVKDSKDVFMLIVKGDSMINAGILDRDFIIVRKQDTARNGEIIVALIEDEATVKRFLKTDKVIKLIAENDFMKPIIINDVKIIGKVIGVIRKYF
ncbi:MAG: transcriptional repressor LexA [Actinobacteria bacterium]|nr:transcriptional repressor LexA [Actinomycetota bacterium]MCL6087518.1 transcriptional repressor LexA [Actinomycetota bacterium]